MALGRARGYLLAMEPTRQLFERRQADLVRVGFGMVVVATGAIFFTHSFVLAVACGALAVVCGVLWLVRRIRYAKRS